MVSVFVRSGNADKISFDVEMSSTILELKTMIGTSQSIDPEVINLVFKGKILKNDQTVEACGEWCYDFCND